MCVFYTYVQIRTSKNIASGSIYIDFTYVFYHKKPLATEIGLSRIFRDGTI